MIDAKKLREAVDNARSAAKEIDVFPCNTWTTKEGAADRLRLLADAAEAHLATLPAEVEVEQWGTVTPSGRVMSVFDREDDARDQARHHHGYSIVHLKGVALLPPEGK
jgi:peroxiredoxin